MHAAIVRWLSLVMQQDDVNIPTVTLTMVQILRPRSERGGVFAL
jgi:hypothetical protein